MADLYSGMVSDRSYRPGLAPDVVLNDIHHRHAGALDPDLIGLLVMILGLYPPGAVAMLANKEVGVVTKRLLDLRHPIVQTFFVDRLWVYDIPRKRVTASMPQFAVTSVLSRKALSCPLDPEQLLPPSDAEKPAHGTAH